MLAYHTLVSTIKNVVKISRRSIRTTVITNSKQTMKFNVKGLEKNKVDEQTLLEWMVTEDGKRQMAVYAGWGGTLTLFFGKKNKFICYRRFGTMINIAQVLGVIMYYVKKPCCILTA